VHTYGTDLDIAAHNDALSGQSVAHLSPGQASPGPGLLPWPAGGLVPVMVGRMTARLVVLVSGAGTNLQALIDACADQDYGAAVAAVGADRPGIEGLARAERAGIAAFVQRVADYPTRAAWDQALADSCALFDPDLVVSAGFLKLVGPAFLDRFGGRFINTHPALLPAFAGMHAVLDALEYGVKVTGCTVFMVDAGTDTGPVIAQAAVPVRDDDDEATLHERVKVAERALLVGTVGAMVRGGWSVQGRKVKVGR
jgi:phosphoribosylglycinamide formyltransferase 1